MGSMFCCKVTMLIILPEAQSASALCGGMVFVLFCLISLALIGPGPTQIMNLQHFRDEANVIHRFFTSVHVCKSFEAYSP